MNLGDDDLDAAQRDFLSRLEALKDFGPISSYKRTRASNLRAKGKQLSQHLIGTAADIVVPPERVPAFVEAARAQGLQVVNEMNRPGHGAHMHVQLYRAGQAPRAFYRKGGVLPDDR